MYSCTFLSEVLFIRRLSDFYVFLNFHLKSICFAVQLIAYGFVLFYFNEYFLFLRAFLVVRTVKKLPVMQETWARPLYQEDPLEKEMATHSSILAWKIPWADDPGGLQSIKLQRIRHIEWLTLLEEYLVVFQIFQLFLSNIPIIFIMVSYYCSQLVSLKLKTYLLHMSRGVWLCYTCPLLILDYWFFWCWVLDCGFILNWAVSVRRLFCLVEGTTLPGA